MHVFPNPVTYDSDVSVTEIRITLPTIITVDSLCILLRYYFNFKSSVASKCSCAISVGSTNHDHICTASTDQGLGWPRSHTSRLSIHSLEDLGHAP